MYFLVQEMSTVAQCRPMPTPGKIKPLNVSLTRLKSHFIICTIFLTLVFQKNDTDCIRNFVVFDHNCTIK